MIMKTYIIASSEYRANFPDMFIMKEGGTYFGVSEYSYAKFHKYPTSVDFWRNAEGSDAGRYFFVEEVEITDEQIALFDSMTKKYYELDNLIPKNEENPPCRNEFKSSKSYERAFEEWHERYMVWIKENDIWRLRQEKDDIWVSRTKLFLSFSAKVAEFLSNNDNIKYL